MLTPFSGDEGIDFYGRLSIGDLTSHGAIYPVFETSLEIWCVGQAKHYQKMKAATPDIRNLVGAVSLGRAHTFGGSKADDSFRALEIRICDPVFMLFFTTGEISADGWQLVRHSGVAAMDGEMMATFLADRGIGVDKARGDRVFSPVTFMKWLDATN